MTPAELRDWYRVPGVMTDPGPHASLFEDLPRGVAAVCEVVQGLLLHVHWAERYGYKPPPERIGEVQVRPVAGMLRSMLAVDARPLASPRPLERRMLGNCRDFTTLAVALLKHQGVPARARCGFGAYFQPGRFEDHWVCEYWSEEQGRWVLVDAQLDRVQREVLRPAFDPLDVPRDQFIVAGQAWRSCRAGGCDPEHFGIFDMRGMWFICSNLLRDLAALNRLELLPWDVWGLLETDYADHGDAEFSLFDRVASLTTGGDAAFDELRALYDGNARLRVPAVIQSHTPEGLVRLRLPG